MKTLIVGALAAATLAGCSCFVSPQSGVEACTGADGAGFACFDRSGAARRLSQAPEPGPSPSDANSAPPKVKSAHAAKTAKPSARNGSTARHAQDAAKSTTAGVAKMESAADAQPPPAAIDPVIDKAKIAVAVKLENPASASFSEMKRSMRKNTLGQSVDTICGHVKGKKASGEDIADSPFLYLVKDDEAYVADGSPTSASSTAYRNICS
jgi:hypothetical protein